MADFQDVILRFTAQDEEAKDALRDFAALLAAVGQEDANPEVEIDGIGRAELDLGKLITLLKAVDSTKAEPVIRPKTEAGRRAIGLMAQTLREMEDFEAEIRVEVDTTDLKDAQDQVDRLSRKLRRQKKNLADFTGSDQFTQAGGRVRASRVRTTQKELDEALEKVRVLREAAGGGIDVKMNTLQARAQLDLLHRHLRDLEKLVVDPEVKLETTQAERAASRIRAVFIEITRLKGTAEVDVHSEKFQLKMAELRREIASVQAEIMRPTIELQGGESAKETIGDVAEFLALLGAMEADPSLDVHGAAKALGDIGAVAIALKDLEGRNVDVDVHVKGRIERLGGVLGAIKHGFGEAQEAATGFAGSIGRVGVSFGPFAAKLGPALLVLLASIGAFLLLLVGAFAALASSAILAAGALATFVAALAAMAGPGLVLFLAVASRLTAILTALKAREQARVQQQQQAVASDHQRAASLRAIQDAVRNLEQAQDNLAQATIQANREMEDSYERVKDAVRDLEHAEISRDRAKLGLERAKLELKQFREELALTGEDIGDMFDKATDVDLRFDTSAISKAMAGSGISAEDQLTLKDKILDVREAKLRERDATDGLHDSEVELARAREDNAEFIRKGIRASSQYVAALEAVEDAQRAVARAHEDKKMLAAQAKSIVLTQELSEEEERVLKLFEKIRDAFRISLKPAIDPIFDALIDTLGGIPGLLAGIAPGMQALGDAVATMIRSVGGALISPKNINAFNDFAKAAAKLTGPVSRGLIALFDIFIEIAKAALPFLLDMAEKFADRLTDWAEWAGKGTNMRDLVARMVDSLRIWLDVAFQLSRVFIGFLDAAAGPGDKLAISLANSLKSLADFLNSDVGKEKVTEWLTLAAATARDTADAVEAIVDGMIKMGPAVSKAITALSDFVTFSSTAFPAIKLAANPTFKLFDLLFRTLKTLWDWLQGHNIKDAIEENLPEAADLYNKMYDLAGDLWDGFVDGLEHFKDARKKDIENIFKSITNSALHIFIVRSPSKVFRNIGEKLTEGLILGMSGMQSALDENLKIPTLKAAVAATSNITGPGTVIDQSTNIDKVFIPIEQTFDDPVHAGHTIGRKLSTRGRRRK